VCHVTTKLPLKLLLFATKTDGLHIAFGNMVRLRHIWASSFVSSAVGAFLYEYGCVFFLYPCFSAARTPHPNRPSSPRRIGTTPA
jgi:hypothetical protein